MNQTKKENFIHIKFEFEEALQSKIDVLQSERSLINIAKAIKNYKVLRAEELTKKARFHKNIKELSLQIKKIQKSLPKIKMPEILKKEEAENLEVPLEKHEKIKTKVMEKVYDDSLENQLAEIQEKLMQLQS